VVHARKEEDTICCDLMSVVQVAFVNPLINELCMYVCKKKIVELPEWRINFIIIQVTSYATRANVFFL